MVVKSFPTLEVSDRAFHCIVIVIHAFKSLAGLGLEGMGNYVAYLVHLHISTVAQR